ncbi:MAG: hypothetical protein E6J81_15690 [Deltaproteobacteria bacterium]|nr:MAG: hypothetical protein E6J81_15690 [Deltaproteobacteria bacterium]
MWGAGHGGLRAPARTAPRGVLGTRARASRAAPLARRAHPRGARAASEGTAGGRSDNRGNASNSDTAKLGHRPSPPRRAGRIMPKPKRQDVACRPLWAPRTRWATRAENRTPHGRSCAAPAGGATRFYPERLSADGDARAAGSASPPNLLLLALLEVHDAHDGRARHLRQLGERGEDSPVAAFGGMHSGSGCNSPRCVFTEGRRASRRRSEQIRTLDLKVRSAGIPCRGTLTSGVVRTSMDWETWARRAERALDVGKQGDWQGLFAPGATFGDPHTPSTRDLRSVARQTRGIFPDWTQEIIRIRGAGDWAVFEWIGRGTFSLPGAPGAGTLVTIHGATIVEVDVQGRVTAWRDYLDRKEPEEQILAAIGGQGGERGGSRR